jgi:hypothetical protein
MRCQNCHGSGVHADNKDGRWICVVCEECHGSGITSCCEGNPNINKWFEVPISDRLKEAEILIVSTKFDKDGNLVEIKTLVDQKPGNKNES